MPAAMLAAMLAGCGQGDPAATFNQQAPAGDVAADRIECAQAGNTALTRSCTVDRTASHDGLILTVRHPSGAFRRLLVTRDGRGVIAADGAERAQVTVVGSHEIEVALGGDRYRLPATISGPHPGGAR